jgi:hypothetical protein
MRLVPALLLRLAIAAAIAASTLPHSRAQEDAESRRAAIEAIYPVMIAALDTKNFGRARNICEQAILWEPQNPVHHYNLACIEAQAGGARLPRAIGALELAVALGFDDADHMRTDPDLIPIRGDPKFADLVRKAAERATLGATVQSLKIPEPAETAAKASSLSSAPAPAAFKNGLPTGIYYMTRFRPLTRTRERAIWYFAADGSAYRDLHTEVSREELAAHKGPRGKLTLQGHELLMTWSDGSKVSGIPEFEGSGFTWDMGIFTGVTPFADAAHAAGTYGAGEALGGAGEGAGIARKIELRPDGTFTLQRPSARSEETLTGRWQLNGFSLSLTPERGEAWSGLAFPLSDEQATDKTAQLFFRGAIYKRVR